MNSLGPHFVRVTAAAPAFGHVDLAVFLVDLHQSLEALLLFDQDGLLHGLNALLLLLRGVALAFTLFLAFFLHLVFRVHLLLPLLLVLRTLIFLFHIGGESGCGIVRLGLLRFFFYFAKLLLLRGLLLMLLACCFSRPLHCPWTIVAADAARANLRRALRLILLELFFRHVRRDKVLRVAGSLLFRLNRHHVRGLHPAFSVRLPHSRSQVVGRILVIAVLGLLGLGLGLSLVALVVDNVYLLGEATVNIGQVI